jgi:hypothetical protein
MAWFIAPLGGAPILFLTPGGSTVSDGPVAAEAIFETEDGLAIITIRDDLVNTRSAGQLVSGLEFTLGGLTGTSALSSSSADLIQVRSSGSVIDKGAGSTEWAFGTFDGGLILCAVCPSTVLGSAAPSHEIIGPGPYSSANSSIDGNGPHNPVLNQVAVFTIENASITSTTTVSGVVFSFGTNFAGSLTTVRAIDPVDPAPEPRTYALMGTGVIALAMLSRRSRANRESSSV